MSAFPIICGIVLIIFVGIFMSKSKREEVIEEVIVNKEDRLVLIEMFPKGTRANPFKCKINDEILLKVKGYSDYKKKNEVKLEVKGYSDYKKENEVILNGGFCEWFKSCPVGSFAKEYGVTNIYHTPSVAGLRDIWVRFNDGKLNTSSKCKILVEV